MDAHDFISLLSALAVLISALAAFLTARNGRKTDRAHRLLIQWGEEQSAHFDPDEEESSEDKE